MIHAEFTVEEKMHLLFVYGTLKKDCSRSSVMESSRFIGVAKTTPNYKLYDCGTYPALVVSENGGVWGELYEVDDSVMSSLDLIEGVDVGLYRRCCRLFGKKDYNILRLSSGCQFFRGMWDYLVSVTDMKLYFGWWSKRRNFWNGKVLHNLREIQKD